MTTIAEQVYDAISLRALSLPDALHNLERELVQRAMAECKGNQTHAARLLGINRTTLFMKLRKIRKREALNAQT